MAVARVQHVVIIIPSKELVHYPLVSHLENEDMEELIKNELRFYRYLTAKLKHMNVKVINLTQRLQSLVLDGLNLYPCNTQSHPSRIGYQQIAKAVWREYNQLD